MHYEWDAAKAIVNLRKHSVDLADAVGVFEDAGVLVREDPDAVGEARFIALGRDLLGRILVVIYTHRHQRIRLISARKASRRERNDYERNRH
jgi:uncharacterized DUF497 family protein